MHEIIKQFVAPLLDAKVIRDSGLIILLGFTLYMLFKVLTNDLSHVGEYIKESTAVQREVNKSLQENATAIESNSEILRILERRIK